MDETLGAAYRARRTCLSVPASSTKMIEKAKGLPADEVFLDLEDAVAVDAKAQARTQAALGRCRSPVGLLSCSVFASMTGRRRGRTPM